MWLFGSQLAGQSRLMEQQSPTTHLCSFLSGFCLSCLLTSSRTSLPWWSGPSNSDGTRDLHLFVCILSGHWEEQSEHSLICWIARNGEGTADERIDVTLLFVFVGELMLLLCVCTCRWVGVYLIAFNALCVEFVTL